MRKMNLVCLSLISLMSFFGWAVAYETEKQMEELREIQMKCWLEKHTDDLCKESEATLQELHDSIDEFCESVKEQKENLEKRINNLNEERVE